MDRNKIERLREALQEAEAVIVGAGMGMSESAGLTTGGERFETFLGDFGEAYGVRNMVEGMKAPFASEEERWAYYSRVIYLSRYSKAPKGIYETLYSLLDGREGEGEKPLKDYFILTTNVDHQFRKAGFEEKRLFATQGDLGLCQCDRPCHRRTYDNKSRVVKMVVSQGFSIDEKGNLALPGDGEGPARTVPSGLIPYCPVCGDPMILNIKEDENFVQD